VFDLPLNTPSCKVAMLVQIVEHSAPFLGKLFITVIHI